MSISGDIEVMKKLEYNPSSFFAYPKKGNVQENSSKFSKILDLIFFTESRGSIDVKM